MLWFDEKRNMWFASSMSDPVPAEATEGDQLVNLEGKEMKVLQADGTWLWMGPFDVTGYRNSMFEEELGAKVKVEKPRVYKDGERIPSKEEMRTKVLPNPATLKAEKAEEKAERKAAKVAEKAAEVKAEEKAERKAAKAAEATMEPIPREPEPLHSKPAEDLKW